MAPFNENMLIFKMKYSEDEPSNWIPGPPMNYSRSFHQCAKLKRNASGKVRKPIHNQIDISNGSYHLEIYSF